MQASTKRKTIRPQAVLPSAAAATARRTASTSAELHSQDSCVRLSFSHTQACMSAVDATSLHSPSMQLAPMHNCLTSLAITFALQAYVCMCLYVLCQSLYPSAPLIMFKIVELS